MNECDAVLFKMGGRIWHDLADDISGVTCHVDLSAATSAAMFVGQTAVSFCVTRARFSPSNGRVG